MGPSMQSELVGERLGRPIGVPDVTCWKTRILASTCHFRTSPATRTGPGTGKHLTNLRGPLWKERLITKVQMIA
jgi:hypothetical protein